MTDEEQIVSASDQAYQQALVYGRDLARIFVTERVKSEKLEAAYQLLNTVFDSTPDGLIVLDKAFIIQRANAAFERLAEKKVVGLPIGTLLAMDALAPAFQMPELGAFDASRGDPAGSLQTLTTGRGGATESG